MTVLTFEKTIGKKVWRKQIFLVLGSAGIGKSELFADERSLYLDIEGTINHLDAVKFPKDRPFMDWDELEATVDQLVAMKQKGTFPAKIDTVVVDTSTRLVNLATSKTLDLLNNKFKDKNWEALEEVTIGGDKGNPGWAMRTNLVDNLYGKLKQLECAIVTIGHMDSKKKKQDNGIEIDKQTISIGGQVGNAFVNGASQILNIVSKNEGGVITRTVRTLGTATIEAKSHGMCIPDGWVLENPVFTEVGNKKVYTAEALSKAAAANHAKLRSFFAE